MLETPVALFIFNRPALVARVLAEIARAKPRKLLVVADGPRASISSDPDHCVAARELVDRVDWNCEVLRNFSNGNLGCRRRLLSGLDWIFEHEPEAIVLEDDCLPDPSFFPFCEELLGRYREDPRVGLIVGTNALRGRERPPESYFFSRYPFIWGWATWRRAWESCDATLSGWPLFRDQRQLERLLGHGRVLDFWSGVFDRAHAEADGCTEWLYAWVFSCWSQNALTIVPSQNLVSNIGFGPDGTHLRASTWLADLPTMPMAFPLRHPIAVQRSVVADAILEHEVFIPRRGLTELRSGLARVAARLGFAPRR